MAGPRALVLALLVILLCLCLECSAGKKCKYNKQKYKPGEVIEVLEDNCVELKCSKKGKKVELTPIENCTCDKEGYLTFSTEKVSWDVASERCKSFGARLAVLTNPKGFHEFALNIYQGQGGFWLGATDKSREGTWTWINGEPLGSFPWGPNEPNDSGGNEDCLEWYHNNNYNDEVCTKARGYVCEHGYN